MRASLFVLPIAVALALRAAVAFSTHDILEWDETYYLSLAVTAANGGGLYPYIYGFGPMHAMGGIGYAAYSYALAVKVFGPTIFALRAVSLAASVLGLAGMWTLTRLWYGSGAAWVGTALIASLQLFVLSNSARMDSWTFAYVAWALVLFTIATGKADKRRWHLAAGFVFALGLQVHLDTVVTALACGCVYLVRYAADARRGGRVWLPAHPLIAYTGGFVAGLLLYVAFNVLPDPSSYLVTTVVVRVDAVNSYASGRTGILGSFLDPQVLLAKEWARYRQLFALTPVLELAFVAGSLAALAIRRNAADRIVGPLAIAVWVCAAIVLNNASPLYFIHVLPALLVPLGALFTHGISRPGRVAVEDMRPMAVVVSLVCIAAVCAGSTAKAVRTLVVLGKPAVVPQEVASLRARVDRRCTLAADGALYVPYLSDYSYFISVRDTEVKHGMMYYRTTDETAYWRLKQPDAVFAPGGVRPALARYIADRGFAALGSGLWVEPSGRCRASR